MTGGDKSVAARDAFRHGSGLGKTAARVYELVLASGGIGTDALAAISEHQPSVVLLDLGLPGMDGYQVAELIRAHPLLHDTRLVALTGWGHDEARRRTSEAGFEHHLVKPVDAEVLRSLLMEISS